MTLGRNHIVAILLLLVAVVAVGVAVYYVENVFKERAEFEDKVREGRPEDLVKRDAPPKKPERSMDWPPSRSHELLVVSDASGRRCVVIRGNGEFARLPAADDEPGPLVTGILDSARIEALLAPHIAAVAPGAAAPYDVVVALSAGRRHAGKRDAASVAALLTVTGRETNRAALPERAVLTTAPVTDPEAPEPWPLRRAVPSAFEKGADLVPESDKAAYRQALKRLAAPGVTFSHAGAHWRVTALVLLP